MLALLLARPAEADEDTIDLTRSHPTFTAKFDKLPALRRGPVPRTTRPLGDPSFVWLAGGLHATGSWATRPGELQAYPTGDAIAQGALNPFSIEAGALAITAHKAPALGMPYVSGSLSSYPFAQTYGYFEMTAQFPSGRGLWPAFWLLPADDTWPPEIDIVETLGQTPGIDYTSIHTRDPATQADFTQPNSVADTSSGFHSYGVDWGPRSITFYFDRRKLVSRATPADMHRPFYLTLNLAVGGPGSWPGPPDGTTVFPAKMLIRAVTVWQRY